MIHICWALSVEQIIKRVSLKTEGVKIKSYDINSSLEVTVSYIWVYYRWKRFILLDIYWKSFLN